MSDFLAHPRARSPRLASGAVSLIFLAALAHAALTEGALRRLPASVWRDIATFAHCARVAAG